VIATVAAVLLLLLLGSALVVVRCRHTLPSRWFRSATNYETLYSADEAVADSPEAVNIRASSAAAAIASAPRDNVPAPVYV